MFFKYKGITNKGVKTSGIIEANSKKEVNSLLKKDEIICESIIETNEKKLDFFSFFQNKNIPVKEISEFSLKISLYLDSGVNLHSALKVIEKHYLKNKKMSMFISLLIKDIEKGSTFFNALDTQNIYKLPFFYTEAVKMSENGGILNEVLKELSRFLTEQEQIRKEIKSSLSYPFFMIFIAILMIVFMLTFIVPQITSIFSNLNQELPQTTKIVIFLGKFISENLYFILFSILFLTFLFTYFKKTFFSFKFFIHKLIVNIPFFGNIVYKSEIAKFSYMVNLLIKSGIPFVKSIDMATKIIDNEYIKKFFTISSKQVVEGELFSKCLNRLNFKDTSFIYSVSLGEETSNIGNILQNVSLLYFQENRNSMKTLLTFLEPILMLFVGGTIGFIVTAMLLPIFSMSIK